MLNITLKELKKLFEQHAQNTEFNDYRYWRLKDDFTISFYFGEEDIITDYINEIANNSLDDFAIDELKEFMNEEQVLSSALNNWDIVDFDYYDDEDIVEQLKHFDRDEIIEQINYNC